MPSDNLELWNSVETTNPEFAKDFKKTGFSGTSINPMYLLKRATELWGPCGGKWRIEHTGKPIEGMKREDGIEQIWVANVRIYYPVGDGTGFVEHVGVAPFVSFFSNAKYWKTDEEAPKKAVTNGISKALSLLGFSADLWLGYYNSPEYVKSAKDEFEKRQRDNQADAILARLEQCFIQSGCKTDGDRDDLCLFWSNGAIGFEAASEDPGLAKSLIASQRTMTKTIPVAEQLSAAKRRGE